MGHGCQTSVGQHGYAGYHSGTALKPTIEAPPHPCLQHKVFSHVSLCRHTTKRMRMRSEQDGVEIRDNYETQDCDITGESNRYFVGYPLLGWSQADWYGKGRRIERNMLTTQTNLSPNKQILTK